MARWRQKFLFTLLLTAGAFGCDRAARDDGDYQYPDPCSDLPSSTPLDWEETSALGVSARDAFSAIVGSCEAPLSWRTEDGNPLLLSPRTGQSKMRVSVVVDEASARLMERRGLTGAETCGGDYLAVTADVRFDSADGTFADGERITLRYQKATGVAPFGFDREQGELGGRLSIGSPNERVVLAYRSAGAGAVCAGEITLSVLESSTVRAFNDSHELGAWSNTGCRLGLAPVALDPSSAEDMEVLRAIARVWSAASYAGHWEDGTRANLAISLQLPLEFACERRSDHRHRLEIPVQLSYGSDDERVGAHTSDARVDVFLGLGGEVQELRLELSETLACESVDSIIPYRDETCAELSNVLSRLSLSEAIGTESETESWFALYEFARVDPTGHASRTSWFTLDGRASRAP